MNPTVEQLLKDFVALGLGPLPAFEGESPDAYRERFWFAYGDLRGRAMNALFDHRRTRRQHAVRP
jgi:hypothetical protein